MEDARRIRVGSGAERVAGLVLLLETLNVDYTFDARGRMRTKRDGGVPPRFVLGRAREGCVWRFRHDVAEAVVAPVARLAGREPGVAFDGELPAPPERLRPIETLFVGAIPAAEDAVAAEAAGAGDARASRAHRVRITRDGVTVGELWTID